MAQGIAPVADAGAMSELDSLQERLGVSFESRALLQLALVHSSSLNEAPGRFAESNERLEFLGDALIGLVVANEVYRRYPDRPEGELTALRSDLVRGETLARTATSLDLGQQLSMGRGEEAGGGRERPSNLAAAFEALVGAMFLDRGYEVAREFVLRALSQELSDLGERRPAKNPKSALQELVQSGGGPPPEYRVASVTGKDHARQFTVEVVLSGRVMGSGTGRRKSEAEQAAAAKALTALGEEA